MFRAKRRTLLSFQLAPIMLSKYCVPSIRLFDHYFSFLVLRKVYMYSKGMSLHNFGHKHAKPVEAVTTCGPDAHLMQFPSRQIPSL